MTVADSVQVASQLTLKQEDYPGFFRWEGGHKPKNEDNL